MELTIEQKRALALASARQRAASQSAPAAVAAPAADGVIDVTVPYGDKAQPPDGARPGSREYANWAAEQVRAGKSVPQVSPTPPEASIPQPDLTGPMGKFDAAYTSAVNDIPLIGGPLLKGVEGLRALVHGVPAEQIAAETAAARDANPVTSKTAGVASSLLSLAPLASTRLGQMAFGLTGSGFQRLLFGGLSGGTLAGGDALIDAGSIDEAGQSAALGAGLGAAGGYAAPYIESGLSSLAALLRGNSGRTASGLSRPSRDVLIRAMESADALGPQGVDAIRQGGQTGMLVDASPAAMSVLDTALQRGGPGANAARRLIEQRAAQANTTVNDALDATLGAPQGVNATETAIRRGTAQARSDAYEGPNGAYRQPIDYSSDAGRNVESLLRRVPQGIIGLANRMMQMEGHQSAQIMARIAEDGTVTYMRMPDVRQIDYITRALNTAAKSGEGQGALGGQTDIGRIYGNLAREIRDQARTAVPAYDNALKTAAHPIQEREALRFGESLLSPSVARDEARDTIEAMTAPQLAQVRQGVRSRIDEVLANVKAVSSDPNLDAREAQKALQDLSSRAAREKIRMILDDEAVANRLFAQIAQASRALQLRASVAANSRTAGRGFVDEAVKATRDGPISAATRGEPLNMGRRLIQDFFGTTPANDLAASDRVYQELARALTLQGSDATDMLSGLAARAGLPDLNAPWAPGSAQSGADYMRRVRANP